MINVEATKGVEPANSPGTPWSAAHAGASSRIAGAEQIVFDSDGVGKVPVDGILAD